MEKVCEFPLVATCVNTLELDEAPHLGIVYLDQLDHTRWQLTNTVTCERAPLHLGDQAELIHDESNGLSAVSGSADATGDVPVQLTNDVLLLRVFTSPNGDLYLSSPDGSDERFEKLDTFFPIILQEVWR